MCDVCGCGQGEVRIEGHTHDPNRDHRGHSADHQHIQHHHGAAGVLHDYGKGPARAHAPGLSQSRMVQIEQDILSKNNAYADQNRRHFHERGIFALNLVSSPGSGKTTLLTRTIEALRGTVPMGVVEGDQRSSQDAERVRKTGVSAVQVNTGKGCHLDAHMVGHALESLALADKGVLFIENVGNLVCPASFDLGEAHKVVILSVTEGDDKPLKYPDMFHAAALMLVNKTDLLPYVQFDVDQCAEYARRVNPAIDVVQVSATSGEGMEAWYQWIHLRRREAIAAQVEGLETTVVQLKAELNAG